MCKLLHGLLADLGDIEQETLGPICPATKENAEAVCQGIWRTIETAQDCMPDGSTAWQLLDVAASFYAAQREDALILTIDTYKDDDWAAVPDSCPGPSVSWERFSRDVMTETRRFALGDLAAEETWQTVLKQLTQLKTQ